MMLDPELDALDALHREAEAAERRWPHLQGAERIVTSRQHDALVRNLTREALGDHARLLDSGWTRKKVARELGNTCLQAGSFFFAAGADATIWRPWCGLAGRLMRLGGELSYALQLCTIARTRLSDDELDDIRIAAIPFREQVVRHVVLHDTPPPSPGVRVQSPDDSYAALVVSMHRADVAGIERAIVEIVEFWCNEIDTERFDPGGFPVFDPEVNTVVAALADRGMSFGFPEDRVRRFLEAGLP